MTEQWTEETRKRLAEYEQNFAAVVSAGVGSLQADIRDALAELTRLREEASDQRICAQDATLCAQDATRVANEYAAQLKGLREENERQAAEVERLQSKLSMLGNTRAEAAEAKLAEEQAHARQQERLRAEAEAELAAAREENERLKSAEEELFGSNPCPKCGKGITSGCYGCELKAAREETRVLREMLLDIAEDSLGDTAPINCGMNSVQAVLSYLMPEGKWTEARLAALRSSEEPKPVEDCPCGDGTRPGHPSEWCGQGSWKPKPEKKDQ